MLGRVSFALAGVMGRCAYSDAPGAIEALRSNAPRTNERIKVGPPRRLELVSLPK
jgi:hypothetical protein